MKTRLACLSLLGMLCLPLSIAAQEGAIRGTVLRETGAPASNATVRVVDTEIGTFADEGGRYRLEVPPGTYQVEAGLIGFSPEVKSVAVEAGQVATLDFRLATKAVELGELVVSLSADQTRRVEIGADIERLNAEVAADKMAGGSLSDLINARATGITVSQSSGEVGSAQRIRIRGATSITQDNNPIIYVDGIRVSNQSGTGPGSHDFGDGQTVARIDDLNPDDIADIQVLKGPTAAALYGSEAAAGVVLIETKKGTAGDARFTFSTEQGFSDEYIDYPDNFFNVTSAGGITSVDDPLIQQWRPIQNPVTGDVFARHNPLMNPNTSPFRTGRRAAYDLSVRGGSAGVDYFSSLKYEEEGGTLRNNNLRRYALRANIGANPVEAVDIDVSTGYISSDIRLPDNDRSSLAMHGNGLSGIPITSFGTLPNGSMGDCLATVLLGQPESVCESKKGNQHNTFEKLESIRNQQELERFIGSVTANWRPLDFLSNRLTVGVDVVSERDFNLVPLDEDRPFGDDSKGLIDDRRFDTRVVTADFASTVNAELTPDLSSSSTVGAQYFSTHTEAIRCRGEGGFAAPQATACDASLIFTGFSDRVDLIEAGAFFQQRLGYKDYLFATGAVRVDDNSAFGENQKAIWSPSANLSAVISQMPFWDVDVVSNLRFRFAWGTAAQAPDPFAAARTFRPVRLEQGGQQVTGISPLAPGNPDLTAERNEEFEVGVDAGLLDDRVQLKVTYYDQVTRDAIVQTRVAPSTGFTQPKFVNIGRIENNGFEGLVNARVLDLPDVQWDVDFKVSTQNPVVADLGGELPIIFGLGPSFQMHREGFSPGHIWGVVVAEAERDANGNIVPGSVQLMPGNVNDPNFPNQVALGRAEPNNDQSLATTITLFDNLRVYTLFDRAGGFVKYDLSGNFSTARQTTRQWAFRQVDVTPEEQAMIESGFAGSIPFFVTDGDFIKWRELTVKYSVPRDVVARLLGPLETASLTLGIRNLATWTDYQGLDPESNFDGGSDSHSVGEFRNAPPVRHFFARLSVTF